jgi:hypothetical protein
MTFAIPDMDRSSLLQKVSQNLNIWACRSEVLFNESQLWLQLDLELERVLTNEVLPE